MSLGCAADACPPAKARWITCGAWFLTGLVCLAQCGCTALISTTSLREALLDTTDPVVDADSDEPPPSEAVDVADETAAEPLVLVKPTATAEQTIDEAIERLAKAGHLDDSAQAALISMLEKAPQEDWPAIIDAFIEALDTSHVVAKPVAPAVVAPPAVAEPADSPAPPAAAASAKPEPPLEFSAVETVPLVFPTADVVVAAPVAAPAVIEPVAAVVPVPVPVPVEEPSRPALVVANPCFATRVRGWGAVDRFEQSRFRPGQDVIIYFELENLESRETESGHTTRIDAALRLIANDGRTLHDWSFEPVEETCPGRRRDYFARYVLRLPEHAPPETCRLEVSVTDMVGDRTAVTSLPLEIAAE